eukprot:XP_014632901.1 cilia- and flagella-associated protein 251-like [Glycine max]
MGAQNRHRFLGYNQGGLSGFKQGRNFTQGLSWRNHLRNQFKKEQRSQLVQNSNQGVDLYEKTSKLEETLNQFMQISMPNYRTTKSSMKNLEIQVGQLAKEMVERPSSSFGADTEKNPKEECRVVLTRSKRRVQEEEEEKAEGDQSEEGRADKEEEKEEEEEKREEEVEKKVLTSKTKS